MGLIFAEGWERCDVASVCETYFLKNTEKVNNLRPDSLAQVLAYANVYAGCQALVFDTCMGVVVAACADRMDGESHQHASAAHARRTRGDHPPAYPLGRGRILAAFAGQQHHFDAMKRFNFSEKQEAVVVPFHTTEIGKLAEAEAEEPDESPDAIEARAQV